MGAPTTPTRPDSPATRWQRRCDELATLTEGWYDGHGKPVHTAAITWLENLAHHLSSTTVERARIYPTVDGQITVEWAGATHDIELRRHPDHIDISAYDPISATGDHHHELPHDRTADVAATIETLLATGPVTR